MKKIILLFLLFTSFTLFISCTDSSNNPQNGENITVSIALHNALNKIGTSPIVLDTVKILLKDVKFRHSTGDSANVSIGPVVVYLNLDGTATEFASGTIAADEYDKIKFRLHKPEPGDVISDPEFTTGLSGEFRYSAIVKGTYNGFPFTYRSTKTATQEIIFNNLIVLSSSVKTNVTLSVDVNSWFYKGGLALDPDAAANHNDIDNNIKDSFKKAFRDTNKDGIAD